MAALATVLTARIQAQGTEAYQNFIPGGYPQSMVGYTLGTAGWSFQPLTDVSVTALGSFDDLLNNQGPVVVGLWTADGMLLATHTITSGSTLVNECRYETIPAVLLFSGQTYFVGASSTSGDGIVFNAVGSDGETVIMAPQIELGMGAESSATGFNFPSSIQNSSGYAFLTSNFEFQPVPEPAIFWLMGAGLPALLALRRRC